MGRGGDTSGHRVWKPDDEEGPRDERGWASEFGNERPQRELGKAGRAGGRGDQEASARELHNDGAGGVVVARGRGNQEG